MADVYAGEDWEEDQEEDEHQEDKEHGVAQDPGGDWRRKSVVLDIGGHGCQWLGRGHSTQGYQKGTK